MKTIFIADDEAIIRNGIKHLLDWGKIGFEIIGEAANGENALSSILEKQPDVVLLDIRMPKMLGLDVAREARSSGFKGKFIILSGYSDFKYAQEAIQYGVEFYLTKPIDEDDLKEKLYHISKQIDEESIHIKTVEDYRQKAKKTILEELLLNLEDIKKLNLKDMNIEAEIYQVVIYEKCNSNAHQASYKFGDYLRLNNHSNAFYENVMIEGNKIILLKGSTAIHKFNEFLDGYNSEKNSEKSHYFDKIFLSYGHSVFCLEDIHNSYEEAYRLQKFRFFCEIEKNIIGYNEIPRSEQKNTYEITTIFLQQYCERFVDYIQTYNGNIIIETLRELTTKLSNASNDIDSIKLLLTDFYLQIKEKICNLYNTINIPFPTNAWIIDCIKSKYYLYEIILFFRQQFEMIMNFIGDPSNESTMNDILYYIAHNYMNNIKLETIAQLFGYNTSYLGKIFSKKTGENFNSYVDHIRIHHSKKLLEEAPYKVYEIAQRVGYMNVDYFHMKFKKYVGISPAEYRKKYRE